MFKKNIKTIKLERKNQQTSKFIKLKIQKKIRKKQVKNKKKTFNLLLKIYLMKKKNTLIINQLNKNLEKK